jgi:hypothetical protein
MTNIVYENKKCTDALKSKQQGFNQIQPENTSGQQQLDFMKQEGLLMESSPTVVKANFTQTADKILDSSLVHDRSILEKEDALAVAGQLMDSLGLDNTKAMHEQLFAKHPSIANKKDALKVADFFQDSKSTDKSKKRKFDDFTKTHDVNPERKSI